MSADPKPLRLAVLGCGHAAELAAGALRKRRDVAVHYASRDGARARAFAQRLGGAGAFDSYEAAIGSDRVDAVLVATPPGSHLPLTLDALRAGKHVVVEKPPFMDTAEFRHAADAARAAGRRLLVAENYHYKPLAVRLRTLLAAGAIGEVRLAWFNAVKQQRTAGWRDDAALAGGGALFEGGIHWVSFAAHLGLPVRSAHGFGPSDRHGERGLLVAFQYERGAAAALAYSWEIPSPLRGLRVSRMWGREGSIAFESNGLWLVVWGRRKRLWVLPGAGDLVGRKAMWQDFVQSLRAGTPAQFETADALRDLELVEQIYASLPPSQ